VLTTRSPTGKLGSADWHPQEGGTPAGRLLRSKSAEQDYGKKTAGLCWF